MSSGIDRTPFYHAALSLIPFTIGYVCGNIMAGCMFAIGGWMFREHTQAEAKWIERYGDRKRANMPAWGGFDPRVWDIGSVLDFGIPIVVLSIFYIIMRVMGYV